MTPAKLPRWITVDPGEDTGLSVWEENRLVYGDTLKMDVVGRLFYYLLVVPELASPDVIDGMVGHFLYDYPEAEAFWKQVYGRRIERVVAEDWRLYPWVMYTPDGRASHALDFDQCRTARLLGKIDLCTQGAGVPFYLQGADIKETAVAAGAEQLYWKPLHENRHQNDAVQHGVFYNVIELKRPAVDGRD